MQPLFDEKGDADLIKILGLSVLTIGMFFIGYVIGKLER